MGRSVQESPGVVSGAFPKHATRVRIADRVMRAVFAGHAAKIAACGWSVVANKLA